MKQVFTELQTRIKEVSEIMFIDLFRNQFVESEKNHPTDFPAILLHFDNMSFENYPSSVQLCSCLLRVLLAVEKYADFYETSLASSEDKNTALAVFDIHDKVFAKLQGFSGLDSETTVIASPMRRLSEIQDTSYTHIYVFIMEFELKFWDTSASTLNDYEAVDLGFTVQKAP